MIVLALITLATTGAMAFTVQSTTFLGNVTTDPYDNSIRDLGWTGRIGNTTIDVFGDSFKCDNAYYQTNCGPLHYYLYTNAAGIEESPTTFRDSPNATTPSYFCPYFPDEGPVSHGLGVTNPIQLNSTFGVVFTHLFLRPNYTGIGDGVATVSISNGIPTCTRLSHYWWNGTIEPHYGALSAWVDPTNTYLYALGDANATNAGGDWVYMARVPVQQATTLSAYQYWNGNSWQTDRITAGRQYALLDTDGNPLTMIGQGQGMYNKYLKQYIYCDRDNNLDYDVVCRTSQNPQGPYSAKAKLFAPATIGNCTSLPKYNGQIYGASFHPWYDDSQKSFVMWFTCGPNIIQSVNVTLA